MAYAEKRRGPSGCWRARWRTPDGTLASAIVNDAGQPFTEKIEALNYGRDQEAKIRAGKWRDPAAGQMTLAEWITTWWAGVDVGRNTVDGYQWRIERLILPTFGDWPLDRLSTPDIAAWELNLERRDGFAASSAQGGRALLITILGDAAEAGLIESNPATRPRRRGRKTGRAATRPARRGWPTPLEVVLLAERASILSGQPDEFTMIATIGWTGCRWSELVGMQRDCLAGDTWHLDWQIYAHDRRWWRTPPKDDSQRDVDLPPFLATLLARQQRDGRPACRACDKTVHPPGIHVFGVDTGTITTGGVKRPRGGHPRGGNWEPRYFRPAADGWYPRSPANARPRAPRPVLINPSDWPGTPLLPAWPPADPHTEAYEPPHGAGIRRVPPETPVASWLPIRAGLVPHGLRHGHKVWLDEEGVPAVLKRERIWGGNLAGVEGIYSHVSPDMRTHLKTALQRRWETALRQRAAMCPTSPVPLLNELLQPYRSQDGDGDATVIPLTAS